MTFVLGKLAWLLACPSNLLVLLAAAGLLLALAGRRRAGTPLLVVAVGGLALAWLLPLGAWLLLPLEARFPPGARPGHVDGVVVLGGSTLPEIGAARGQPALTDAAERPLALIELGRRYPDARLLFSGGNASLVGGVGTEAEGVADLLVRLGFDAGRVILEDRSRTTRENALAARALVAPGAGETWLLVTSAAHMPRAVGVFRALGWPVVPWPVDYRTTGEWWPLDTPTAGARLDQLDDAAREWLALAWYRALGWTDRLFPGP